MLKDSAKEAQLRLVSDFEVLVEEVFSKEISPLEILEGKVRCPCSDSFL